MNRRAELGWAEFIIGIALAVLGAYTLINPDIALRNVVLLGGIIAIACGIADAVFYVRLERRTGFAPGTLILSAVLNILLGIVLLLNLNVGAWLLSILFPLWFMLHCIGRLANAGIVRLIAGKGSYWLTLIINILGLGIGVALLVMPQASTLVFGYLMGIYLLAAGIGSIITALSRLLRAQG